MVEVLRTNGSPSLELTPRLQEIDPPEKAARR